MFDVRLYLKGIALGTAIDIEIYNVMTDPSWEKIRDMTIELRQSLPQALKNLVRDRILPIHKKGLLKYPKSNFDFCYSTAIHRMSTILDIYRRDNGITLKDDIYRLTKDAQDKMENHLTLDKVNKYNYAVRTVLSN